MLLENGSIYKMGSFCGAMEFKNHETIEIAHLLAKIYDRVGITDLAKPLKNQGVWLFLTPFFSRGGVECWGYSGV